MICNSLRRGVIAVSLAVFASFSPLHAQSGPIPGASTPMALPRAEAGTRDGPIAVDGRVIEPDWAAAPVATGFVQRQPHEGQPAEHQTDVRVLFDEQAMYIAARMHDPEPHRVPRQMVRRDEEGNFDYFSVELDPNLDRRTGYRFRVSASNVQRDEYYFDDNERDPAWDAVWESAVKFDSAGWTVEIRIPLSQLRYRATGGVQRWGVNFMRRRLRSNEESHFALISQLQRGHVSQYGMLDGVRITRKPRNAELRPYVLTSAERGPGEANNPFRTGSENDVRAGLDLRYGLGGAFTLDATVNPDFGQVEADPAVINLSAFETFFQERRPFFVEDARIFDYSLSGGQNRVFYSRRIGRSPQGRAPEGAEYSDAPDAATILGAAKLTGRTQRGLSLGVLAAVTRGEYGRVQFAESGAIGRYLAEPQSTYSVVRIRQDFNGGASTIGMIGTALARDLPDDGNFDFLPSNAFAAGLDLEHQWADRTWALIGYVAGSHVRGDSTAMIRIQRSSVHYFQRPDTRRLTLDSSATMMGGYDWRLTLEKRRGQNWTGSIWAAQVSPGFEVNDLGFSSRQEVLDGGIRVAYREIRPGRVFRNYNVTLSTFQNYSHDVLDDLGSRRSWAQAHTSGSFSLNTNAQFLNYWRIDGNLSVQPERMDRAATRGGPMMIRPASIEARLGIDTDNRRRISLGPGVSFERSAQGANARLGVNMDVGVRPSSNVDFRFEPNYSRSTIGAQYVGSTDALAYAPTFGRRYLFGEIERREFSVQSRMNAAFSPTLSFQLFLQPLLSSGDYVAYKQYAAPSSYEFLPFQEGTVVTTGGTESCAGGRTCVNASRERHIDFDGDGTVDYSFTDRDFNVRSLRGNAVLRWEYRPGSTLFLVWQRRQADEAVVGRFDFRRDWEALLRAPAENVFMVKARYWIGF